MPVKHYPPTPYVKRVRPWKLHLFTTIQVLCLVLLWTVKSSQFSLAFPFFLIMMVPIRQNLTALYKPEEMQAVIYIIYIYIYVNQLSAPALHVELA